MDRPSGALSRGDGLMCLGAFLGPYASLVSPDSLITGQSKKDVGALSGLIFLSPFSFSSPLEEVKTKQVVEEQGGRDLLR